MKNKWYTKKQKKSSRFYSSRQGLHNMQRYKNARPERRIFSRAKRGFLSRLFGLKGYL